MMDSVQELAPVLGVGPACTALGVPRSTVYRRQRPVRQPRSTVRQAHPRTLSPAEQTSVRDVLNSERFVDQAPRTVYATLLDEGVYLCHWRTMYRLLRADAATREHRPTHHPPVPTATARSRRVAPRPATSPPTAIRPSPSPVPTSSAPPVAPGFFPLDDELALLPGRLTPRLHAWVVRLATWMPFGAATSCLVWLTRTTLSPATAQRLTTAAGQAAVTVQTAAAIHLAHDLPPAPDAPDRLVVSVDGAMVPVRGVRPWREVKTMVIGEPSMTMVDGTARVQTQNLSYFSRMTDATTFADLALVETHRRGLDCAAAVAAVADGAAWIQGFVDLHRPDAVRILDFPHASGYLAQLGDLVFGASSSVSHAWQDTQRQHLKTLGAGPVLATISGLTEQATDAAAFATAQQYLTHRQGHMDYPGFQAAGWPIGSGMVESANKLVVEARMKGSGMHWDADNVDGMLALRNAVCNDRWDAVWAEIWTERRAAAQTARWKRQQQRRPPPPTPTAHPHHLHADPSVRRGARADR